MSLLAKARTRQPSVRTGKSRTSSQRRNIYSSDEEEGSYDEQNDTFDSEISSSIGYSSPESVVNKKSRRRSGGGEVSEDYQLEDEDGSAAAANSSHIGIVHPESHFKQRYAPCSTLFCVVQCIILPLMMWQCGVAPLNINPMIGPYPDALNYWGAKNAVLIIEDGEAWRLFTPIFLHAGIIHLAGNVLVQYDMGNLWEMEWGSLIWMIVYVGSGFGSSVFSTCFMPDNISVGSSGAVMGLFGAKFSEIVLLCFEKSKTKTELAGERARKRQACHVVGGIIIVAAMSFIPYVDWAAHLGGMIAGFVLGLVCFSFKIRSWPFMALWFVVGVGSAIALYSALMTYMYTDVEANDELR